MASQNRVLTSQIILMFKFIHLLIDTCHVYHVCDQSSLLEVQCSDSARHQSQDICPPIFQIVHKISLIKECPEEF